MTAATVAAASLAVVLLLMAGESAISRRHERWLRQHGAVEPPGDVYGWMQWAYPGAFVLMGTEGIVSGGSSRAVAAAGIVLFLASKALKYWAMASLGPRWTFRVLVIENARLVTSGPYAFVRHPNYVAVVGEMVAMALLVGARLTGPLATVLFGVLLWKRVAIEDRALRHPACSRAQG